ncbi:MAG: hypothetical protein R3B45_00390 [Bdellovibrionota bacterium]
MSITNTNSLFESTFISLNKIKDKNWRIAMCISIVGYFCVSLIFICLWAMVRPDEPFEQLIIGGAAFLSFWLAGGKIKREKIEQKNFLLHLEMSYPNTKYPSTSLVHASQERLAAEEEWKPILEREVTRLANFEKSRMRIRFSTLLLPISLAIFLVFWVNPAISIALTKIADQVFLHKYGAQLEILQGAKNPNETKNKMIDLGPDRPVVVDLLAKNLIKIELLEKYSNIPQTLVLKKPKDEFSKEVKIDDLVSDITYQSFRFNSLEQRDDAKVQSFSLTFSLSETVFLYIPSISEKKPLALVKVKSLPLPKIALSLVEEIKEPWPDYKPLFLNIVASGKTPLAKINLIIRGKNKESRELVNDVMAKDKLKISTNYNILLEPYLDSDLEELEVIGEVIDRATPTPLMGYSSPLRIKVASAYGRYRNTLQTLKDLKGQLDAAIINKNPAIDEETMVLANDAFKQSLDSPFFDSIDRVNIMNFRDSTARNVKNFNLQEMHQLSTSLNDFLFEHEVLDDRERDRDFFIAARSLSRLLEKPKSDRPVEVTMVVERMKRFLDAREKRWKLRVKQLDSEKIPKLWPEVSRNRPFHKAMDDINKLQKNDADPYGKKGIETLSLAVGKYRNWLNELEEAEDAQRKQLEQERQQGLASAQNEIKDLQRKQGQISTNLDKSRSRELKQLTENWPSIKMKQKSNINGTNRLENKLRSLSPGAAERMKLAVQTMKDTVQSGDEENFVRAESGSDFAGRLLRQAENAARQSQKRNRSRGRRRRVSGDQYYGQSVVGGDVEIKREYQVDRRYREDILDEVRDAELEGDDKVLLENYLRKVVR